ncbi:2-hydroxyacid dehydrogenase [Acidiphilium sp.]|uniref:2-hydroxyacid dehydrogenase n=1 Tax=Acidiphilium sp. TaxID=527 RepID=UPI003CFED85D
MTERATILSLGSIMPSVDTALDKTFIVWRGLGGVLDEIINVHAPMIRALVTRGAMPVDTALIDRLPCLELIANFGVGYDSVDVAAAAARGIVVTNTPDVLNDEMGDFTIGLLLATIRRLPQADRYLRAGQWAQGAFPLGASLRGRRIGIAGMGRIGRVVAHRLSGFDVPVAYYARNRNSDLPYRHYRDLCALAGDVDILIVVLPGGAATHHAVDAAVLAALGRDGVLINVARGSVVDEVALIDALSAGRILAAGLDVFAAEPLVPATLIGMDNVVLLPHIGTATHHTRGLMGELLLRNVMSWFEGIGPVTPIAITA